MAWMKRYKQKSLLPKFQLIPILSFQVKHDYVCFIAPIDYCVEWSLVQTFCENCSHFILKWFPTNSFGGTERRHIASNVTENWAGTEKSLCKLGICLCHIIRPLTQPTCQEIERGLFSQAGETLQGHSSGMLVAFAYIFCRSPKGKVPSSFLYCSTLV